MVTVGMQPYFYSMRVLDRPGGLSYSSRSAAMGSSFDARRAGRKLAAAAISASSSAAATRVSGSYGLQPE